MQTAEHMATLLIACKPQKLFVTFGHAVGTIKGILFERRRCIAKVEKFLRDEIDLIL